jgi:hypothetical protein
MKWLLMPRRISKSAKLAQSLPWLRPAKIVTVFKELPGAVFYGEILVDHIDLAISLQAIRDDYEQTDDQATLWHDLSQLGRGYAEISAAIANPATITNCGYGLPPDGPTLTLVASLN